MYYGTFISSHGISAKFAVGLNALQAVSMFCILNAARSLHSTKLDLDDKLTCWASFKHFTDLCSFLFC